MKKKIQKLTLSTETLRNLNPPDLEGVEGGATRICGSTECTATYVCSGCAPCA